MALAILYGAGSGALHAVTGPDHVLSLGPAALAQPRGSWRIGFHWGIGHALGTLLLALPALLLARLLHLEALASIGDRLSGAVLCVTAALACWSLHRGVPQARAEQRSSLLVGLLHGMTGAGSLVLVLPVLVAGSALRSTLFLTAFAVGSTLAMALFTWAIAHLAGALENRVIERARRTLIVASFALG